MRFVIKLYKVEEVSITKVEAEGFVQAVEKAKLNPEWTRPATELIIPHAFHEDDYVENLPGEEPGKPAQKTERVNRRNTK